MDDFKIIVRLLAAIRASEEKAVFDISLIDEKNMRTTAQKRDNLALKLQKAGYVEGLVTSEDIDNAPLAVLWEYSKPSVTLEGLEYIHDNSAIRKAISELTNDALVAGGQMIGAIISTWAIK